MLAAAEGMDAIVNLSVIRPDPVLSFRVNMMGAYHVMQAAVRSTASSAWCTPAPR